MLFILVSSIVLTSLGITGLAVMKMPSPVPLPPVAAPVAASSGQWTLLLMVIGAVAVLYVARKAAGAFFHWIGAHERDGQKNKPVE